MVQVVYLLGIESSSDYDNMYMYSIVVGTYYAWVPMASSENLVGIQVRMSRRNIQLNPNCVIIVH